MCFVDGAVGVPAVALINWDDDLWQIDQTQLRRNNFLIGTLAYYLVKATERDVPLLVAETYAQGQRRLANDLRVAMEFLRDASDTPGGGWKSANIMIEQGIERETRALNSILRIAPNSHSTAYRVADFGGRLKRRRGELSLELEVYYRQLHGRSPAAVALSAEEQAAARKVPQNNTASLKAYFTNRNRARPQTSPHGLMRDEVFNYVDGRRSYYDIYKAVFAEANAAVSWYYGTVTLKDVAALLDAGVETKALVLK